MTQDSQSAPTFSLPSRGPLILGASGRIGRAFRHLWQQGQWPDTAVPLWQSRAPLPHAEGVSAGLDPAGIAKIAVNAIGVRTRGIIVLAGATSGDDAALTINTKAAEAALVMRQLGVAGPVICLSSSAVYDPAVGEVDDDTRPAPRSAYGAAKLAMEHAMAPHAGVTCLRLANVAGCDALLGGMGQDPVSLDRIADGPTPDSHGATGAGPRRSYIGLQTLAHTLVALTKMDDLPKVMNLAQPGDLGMEELLVAAGANWHWQPAPPGAIPALRITAPALQARLPLPPATPAGLVAEARAAGWRSPH